MIAESWLWLFHFHSGKDTQRLGYNPRRRYFASSNDCKLVYEGRTIILTALLVCGLDFYAIMHNECSTLVFAIRQGRQARDTPIMRYYMSNDAGTSWLIPEPQVYEFWSRAINGVKCVLVDGMKAPKIVMW